MKATITIKLIPESRGEMIDKFGGLYRTMREDWETRVVPGLQAGGHLPPQTELRWVLESGRWE